jgi:hypothetical protein
MKTILIEVPPKGTSVQLVLRPGASSGQAVIVASDDVEIRLAGPTPTPVAQPNSASNGKTAARDLDAIFKRLTKLKPAKRAAAVNSIKAMFQVTEPITDDEAHKILEKLRRRGSLSIDANDKVEIHKT